MSEPELAEDFLPVYDVSDAVAAVVEADRETAWQAQALAGPLQAALRVVGAAQLKATVLHALAPYATSTGSVRLETHFRWTEAARHWPAPATLRRLPSHDLLKHRGRSPNPSKTHPRHGTMAVAWRAAIPLRNELQGRQRRWR